MVRTALVIIDMQNDFVLPEILPMNSRAFNIAPTIESLLSLFRLQKMPVFHIVREYRADTSNVEHMRVDDFRQRPRAVAGTSGCEIIDQLVPIEGEFKVIKWRFSAFMGTELDFILRRLKIDRLVICGTQLPNCVRCTVYDAIALEYNVTVINDAVAARTQDVHDANIIDLVSLGIKCVTASEFTNTFLNLENK